MKNNNYQVNVAMISQRSIGQTSLLNSFLGGGCNGPSIYNNFEYKRKIYNNQKVLFEIWDLALTARARSQRYLISKRDGYMISFEPGNSGGDGYEYTLEEIRASLQETVGSPGNIKSLPIVLVATKSDLRGAAPERIWGNKEKYDYVVAKVKEYFPEYPVVVTSAQNGEGVEEAFEILAKKIIDFKYEQHGKDQKIKEQLAKEKISILQTDEVIKEPEAIHTSFFSKARKFFIGNTQVTSQNSIESTVESTEIQLCMLKNDQPAGTTSILERFVAGIYNPSIEATIGACFFKKKIYIEQDGLDKKVLFNIWDTCSPERYRGLAPMYIRKSEAFIICCDLFGDLKEEAISAHLSNITEFAEAKNFVIIFVITKSDLLTDKRFKDYTEIYEKNLKLLHELRTKNKHLVSSVIICSAKDNVNINEIFIHLAKSVLALRNKKPEILPLQRVQNVNDVKETKLIKEIQPKSQIFEIKSEENDVKAKSVSHNLEVLEPTKVDDDKIDNPSITANILATTVEPQTTTQPGLPKNSLLTNPLLQQHLVFLNTLPQENLNALTELKEQGVSLNDLLSALTDFKTTQPNLTQRLQAVEVHTGLDAQTQAEIAYIKKNESLNRYYQALKMLLGQTFLVAKVIASGHVHASQGSSAKVVNGIRTLAGALCPPAAPFLSFATSIVGIVDGIDSYRGAQTLSDWIDLQFIAQLAEMIARQLTIAQEPILIRGLTPQAQNMIKAIQNKCTSIVERIKSGQVLNAQESRALLDANELLSYMKENKKPRNADLTQCVAILLPVIMGDGYVYISTQGARPVTQPSTAITTVAPSQATHNLGQYTISQDQWEAMQKEMAEAKRKAEEAAKDAALAHQKLEEMRKQNATSSSTHQNNGDGTASLFLQRYIIINAATGAIPLDTCFASLTQQLARHDEFIGTAAPVLDKLNQHYEQKKCTNTSATTDKIDEKKRQELLGSQSYSYQSSKIKNKSCCIM